MKKEKQTNFLKLEEELIKYFSKRSTKQRTFIECYETLYQKINTIYFISVYTFKKYFLKLNVKHDFMKYDPKKKYWIVTYNKNKKKSNSDFMEEIENKFLQDVKLYKKVTNIFEKEFQTKVVPAVTKIVVNKATEVCSTIIKKEIKDGLIPALQIFIKEKYFSTIINLQQQMKKNSDEHKKLKIKLEAASDIIKGD